MMDSKTFDTKDDDTSGSAFILVEEEEDGPSLWLTGASLLNITSISPEDCARGLLLADKNRDDLLNEKEFVSFVNYVASHEHSSVSFISRDFFNLPEMMQQEFSWYAQGGEINIHGIRPSQLENLSSEQAAMMDHLCQDVVYEIDLSLTPSPTQSPTQNLSIIEGSRAERIMATCSSILFLWTIIWQAI